MNLRGEQQKLANLNRENKVGKKMNRASGMCGTITEVLTFVSFKSQKRRR